ncbi:hypothetical protein KVR01_013041 [Diaporthe batatas]|uniref:uncharacterized protein n=1 Tax=Diaporthe batatas TaxID=748121 RepID=UPI001D04E6A0|nr:uncharacterized protein KVR01_013041 [Diaporthe batatas]KAG8157051.1 hypothetical protein KVR01_013041 [Diaporthe batatas]
MPRALGDGPYLSSFHSSCLQPEPRGIMWFPFGDDGRIPAGLQHYSVPSVELESQTLVPLSSPDFHRMWKSFGPPTYPPSSPNRVTMVDRAAVRHRASNGLAGMISPNGDTHNKRKITPMRGSI